LAKESAWCKLVCMNEGIVIHTDGGARGNPGPGACSFVAEEKGKLIKKTSMYLGVVTNNTAEYHGVILALTWLNENPFLHKGKEINFYLDSELITRQLNGQYRVKDVKLQALYLKCKNLSEKFSDKIFFKNVKREKNKIADYLVNKELDRNILGKN